MSAINKSKHVNIKKVPAKLGYSNGPIPCENGCGDYWYYEHAGRRFVIILDETKESLTCQVEDLKGFVVAGPEKMVPGKTTMFKFTYPDGKETDAEFNCMQLTW